MLNHKLNLQKFSKKMLLVSGLSIVALLSKSPDALARIPQAECESAFGQTACGYNCVASFGNVRCAEWPGGSCESSFGNITCGPAAPENWMDYYTTHTASNTRNSPRNNTRQRINWEYRYINGCSSEELNDMGQYGWEVIQTYQRRNNTCSVLAKRPR